MTDPTPDPAARLAEIRARTEAATEGPWEVSCRASGVTDPEYSDWFLGWEIEGPPEPDRGQFERGHDAVFIAHARTDIPYLLAQVSALADQVRQANETVGKCAIALEVVHGFEKDANRFIPEVKQDIREAVEACRSYAHAVATLADKPRERAGLREQVAAYERENARLREVLEKMHPARVWDLARQYYASPAAPQELRKVHEAWCAEVAAALAGREEA